MNATIKKFGYPATLIAEYEHWVVLLRSAQPALGSLILAAKSEATAFADLPREAFAEQAKVVADIEVTLTTAVAYDRLNYLMLMMVDPHVHYHVIPRYAGTRAHDGLEVADAGWPKVPDLGSATTLDDGQVVALVSWLKGCWPSAR